MLRCSICRPSKAASELRDKASTEDQPAGVQWHTLKSLEMSGLRTSPGCLLDWCLNGCQSTCAVLLRQTFCTGSTKWLSRAISWQLYRSSSQPSDHRRCIWCAGRRRREELSASGNAFQLIYHPLAGMTDLRLQKTTRRKKMLGRRGGIQPLSCYGGENIFG